MKEPSLLFLDPIQRRKLIAPGGLPQTVRLSFDLGITEETAEIYPTCLIRTSGDKVPLPAPEILSLDEERTILVFSKNRWQKWQRFDERSGRFYKMVFVEQAKPPTVEISGIKMHVTMNGNPQKDTFEKLRSLGKVRGVVLDTCCGLGYTAIALGELKAVAAVFTCERDHNIMQLCQENPWSQGLFNNRKITVRRGNAAEIIAEFSERAFAAILHDPPRYALAPELYEVRFYRQCWRVLRSKGKLYHYTGDPNKAHRKGLAEKTIERLRTAGFRQARKAYRGVIAQK